MLFVLWISNFNSYWACDYLSMLELTLIHVSKKGLDCIKIGKVWSIRVICIRRFGNLSSRLHVSNSGTRTLFDWKCGVSVFHSCNIRIVWGLWSQSNFHDMIISIINIFGFIGLWTALLSCTRMHSPTTKLSLIEITLIHKTNINPRFDRI